MYQVTHINEHNKVYYYNVKKNFYIGDMLIFDYNKSKNKLCKNEINKFLINECKELNLIKNKLTHIYIKPSKSLQDIMDACYVIRDEHIIIKGFVKNKKVVSYKIYFD